MSLATDLDGHTHDFAKHEHTEFPSHDTHGIPTTENIMHVIHNMSEVLVALCHPNVLISVESNCNPVLRLLGELKALISTETIWIQN
jgi:hypothetical protein